MFATPLPFTILRFKSLCMSRFSILQLILLLALSSTALAQTAWRVSHQAHPLLEDATDFTLESILETPTAYRVLARLDTLGRRAEFLLDKDTGDLLAGNLVLSTCFPEEVGYELGLSISARRSSPDTITVTTYDYDTLTCRQGALLWERQLAVATLGYLGGEPRLVMDLQTDELGVAVRTAIDTIISSLSVISQVEFFALDAFTGATNFSYASDTLNSPLVDSPGGPEPYSLRGDGYALVSATSNNGYFLTWLNSDGTVVAEDFELRTCCSELLNFEYSSTRNELLFQWRTQSGRNLSNYINLVDTNLNNTALATDSLRGTVFSTNPLTGPLHHSNWLPNDTIITSGSAFPFDMMFSIADPEVGYLRVQQYYYPRTPIDVSTNTADGSYLFASDHSLGDVPTLTVYKINFSTTLAQYQRPDVEVSNLNLSSSVITPDTLVFEVDVASTAGPVYNALTVLIVASPDTIYDAQDELVGTARVDTLTNVPTLAAGTFFINTARLNLLPDSFYIIAHQEGSFIDDLNLANNSAFVKVSKDNSSLDEQPVAPTGLVLSPNPTASTLQLSWRADAVSGAATRVQLVDASGKLVRDVVVSSGATLDLSELPAGRYTASFPEWNMSTQVIIAR